MADNGSSGIENMYHVYVLKSLQNSKRYIGYTSKNPEERLEEHNKGANSWTRQNKPFKLVYTERCKTKTEAIKRERFLKTTSGRRYLDSIVPR